MILEMLAADELAPLDASGFLVRNWFRYNRNVWLEATVERTGKAFLGMTLNCAKCHEHKSDPLSQTDFYRIRAFFEPYDIRTNLLTHAGDAAANSLVQAFDGRLTDPTYLFARGDEDRPETNQLVRPQLPDFLGRQAPQVSPVALPLESYYPALSETAVKEALARSEAAVRTADQKAESAWAAALAARIKSYELAFRMRMAVPEVVAFNEESESTRRLYGLDQSNTKAFGQQCLAARRLVERGVRFIQIFHGGLRSNHSTLCGQVDLPIAGLLKDLKQRGLLDETLVVWGTGFGRTPGAQGNDGRDHHPYGFSVWLAGGGIRGGIAHGATDELGFHAVEDRHYVTDLHATVLHQLGLEPRRLTIPGRTRLELDYGEPIHGIIS